MIRLLDGEAEITTRFGGGFVHSIDGVEGEIADGRSRDWFFYLNGIESSIGAAEVPVRGGDRVWWDYRDWTDALRTPAVVGSWPEPFAQASAGAERLPVRVVCAGEQRALRRRRRAPRRRGRGGRASSAGEEAERARRCGSWSGRGRRSRDDPTASLLAERPSTSGVFARFERSPAGGVELVVLDERAEEVQSLDAGAGLVAGLRDGEEPADLGRHGHRRGRGRGRGRAARSGLARRPLRGRGLGRARTRLPAGEGRDGHPLPARLRAAARAAAARERARRDAYLGSLRGRRLRLLEPDRARRRRRRGCGGRASCRSADARWPRRRAGRLARRLHRRRQRDRLAARRDDPASAAASCPCSAGSTSAPRRSSRAACWRCGSPSCFAAFAVYSACVDPDRVLRLVGPIARHSALTATLITRLVPLAAADHARLRRPRRCAGRPPPRSAARRWRAGSSPARSTARSTSPRRSSCAATPAALPRRGAGARPGPPQLALRRARRRDHRARGRAADRRRRAGSRRTRRSRSTATPRHSRSPRRCRCSLRRSRSPAPAGRGGGAVAEPLAELRGFSYRYPGAERSLDRLDLELAARRVRGPRRPLGLGQVDAAARALRSRPALPRGRGARARSRSAASTSASTGPAELGGAVGLVAQDPETQVVATTVRGELELPLELRGEPPAARARAIEEVALALGIAHAARPAHRHALGRRAAARRARRGARAPAAARPPRRAHLAARPGRRRRADRPAAAAERGVGDGGRARRAPARALPRGGRPRGRARRRAGSDSTAARASSPSGPRERTDPC